MDRQNLQQGSLLRFVAVPAANIEVLAQQLQELVSEDPLGHKTEILAALHAIEKQAQHLNLHAGFCDQSCARCLDRNTQEGYDRALADLEA